MSHLKIQSSRSRHGVALIIAISVLAVLTLLVMALAYSSGAMMDTWKVDRARADTADLARLGFEQAVAMLGTESDETDVRDFTASFAAGICHISVRPAVANDAIYGSNFVVPRPGDRVVTVLATPGREVARIKLSQTYLLNLRAEHPRYLLYEQRLFAEAGQASD